MITTSHYDLKQSDEEKEETELEGEEIEKNIENSKVKLAEPLDINFDDDDMDDEYGMVATSAPAILDQQTDETQRESTYSFYSSTSMLKLNTFNMVSKINESNSRVNSNNELAITFSPTRSVSTVHASTAQINVDSSQISKKTLPKHQKLTFKDEQNKDAFILVADENEASTPKSQIKSCIKSTNVPMK